MKHYSIILGVLVASCVLFACAQKEEEIPVSSVTISQPTAEIIVGETVKLSAIISPSNATDKEVIWASSRQSVAIIDKSGLVTAIAEGTSNITATAGGKTGTSLVIVSKRVVEVSSIELNKTALSLVEGEEFTLEATVKPDDATDKTVSWSSSAPEIASVDAGKVTAIAEGETTITATAGEKSATCKVVVSKKVIAVESIELNKTELPLKEGESEKLFAVIKPDDATDKSVAWSSSNTNVATVDQSGKVTAVKEGSASITAKAGDKQATCSVTVKKKVIAVTSVTLNKTELSLNEGQSETLTATVKPDDATDKSVAWSSSNTNVATVDQSGKVTAKAKGTATIKAEAQDGSGKSTTCPVTVKRLVSSIRLNKTSISIYNGKTETLTATVIPSEASNTAVTWASSNTSVATVSSSGVVTGKSRGTATITVTADDGSGVQATCEVEVKQYVTNITLDKTFLSLAIDEEATLSVTVLPDNANNRSVTWSSSNNSIASVDNSGKVTAKATGKVKINVTANDGSGVFASSDVWVKKPCPAGAVDLGLSVYWATCNIGASKPEDLGDYYAWGETETKWNYAWYTYKLCNGTDKTLTKYNTDGSYGTVDNKTKLEQKDNVAIVKLGNSWSMPSDDHWTELRNNCTLEWTENYNGSGVNGIIVTAKNGNSLFLPAAGSRSSTDLKDVGFSGHYWSSSLYTDYPTCAWSVCFYNSTIFVFRVEGGYYRFNGFSVRPISYLY